MASCVPQPRGKQCGVHISVLSGSDGHTCGRLKFLFMCPLLTPTILKFLEGFGGIKILDLQEFVEMEAVLQMEKLEFGICDCLDPLCTISVQENFGLCCDQLVCGNGVLVVTTKIQNQFWKDRFECLSHSGLPTY